MDDDVIIFESVSMVDYLLSQNPIETQEPSSLDIATFFLKKSQTELEKVWYEKPSFSWKVEKKECFIMGTEIKYGILIDDLVDPVSIDFLLTTLDKAEDLVKVLMGQNALPYLKNPVTRKFFKSFVKVKLVCDDMDESESESSDDDANVESVN